MVPCNLILPSSEAAPEMPVVCALEQRARRGRKGVSTAELLLIPSGTLWAKQQQPHFLLLLPYFLRHTWRQQVSGGFPFPSSWRKDPGAPWGLVCNITSLHWWLPAHLQGGEGILEIPKLAESFDSGRDFSCPGSQPGR